MRYMKSTFQHKRKDESYIFKLYIAGHEQNSLIARDNLRNICDEYLADRCEIEEVDILEDYETALKERIFVTPTLILVSPEPRASVAGNLNDRDKVISALRLRDGV
jgi:circadian clock protein KaiB